MVGDMLKKTAIVLTVLIGAWMAGRWFGGYSATSSLPKQAERDSTTSTEVGLGSRNPAVAPIKSDDRHLEVTGESGHGVGSGRTSGEALDACILSAISENLIAQFKCATCEGRGREPSPVAVDIDTKFSMPGPGYNNDRWYDRGSDSWTMDSEIFWRMDNGRPSGIVFCQACESELER